MLPPEITKLIGKAGTVIIMAVERGAIQKYADAVDDANPLYRDDEYSRHSEYGTIISPPGFFGWPLRWDGAMPIFSAIRQQTLSAIIGNTDFRTPLDGGIEYDFYHPVHASDTLAAITRISDIHEHEGRSGTSLFVMYETTYTNQDGDMVAKERQVILYR